MWRDTLYSEVLEEFCDPRWYGMSVRYDLLKGGLTAVEDTSKLASRRADVDLTARILVTASTRMAWRLADLAGSVGAVGLTQQGVHTSVAIALRNAGWSKPATGKPGGWWTNEPALRAWWVAHPHATLQEAATQTGLHWRLLRRFSGCTSPAV